MLNVSTIVRKLNPPTITKWGIVSTTPRSYSSSNGYSQEEIEKFRKVFRTMPSYQESIAAQDYTRFLKAVNFIVPDVTYKKFIEFGEKILGGRYELNQTMKYFSVVHDTYLIVDAYLETFDRNKDGYVSKEEFEFGMETLKCYDPKVKNISYKDFVNEADTNKDGKISVAECKAWFRKNYVPS